MTRDDRAAQFFAAMLSNGVGPNVSKETHQLWMARCFEYADAFECCDGKSLDEIKLILHTMLVDEPVVKVSATPSGSVAAPTMMINSSNSARFNKAFNTGYNWGGQDDSSGGVIIP